MGLRAYRAKRDFERLAGDYGTMPSHHRFDISDHYRPKEVGIFVPLAPSNAPTGTIQMNDVFVDERAVVYTVDRDVGPRACYSNTQALVGSRTAGGWPELSSQLTRSVNSTPSISLARQMTRHDRRSPRGVRNRNSSGIV
jgi:hypothetical protein